MDDQANTCGLPSVDIPLQHPPSPANEVQAFRLIPGMTMAHRSGPINHVKRGMDDGLSVIYVTSKTADGILVDDSMTAYDTVLLKEEMPTPSVAQLEDECLHLRKMCNKLMDEAKEWDAASKLRQRRLEITEQQLGEARQELEKLKRGNEPRWTVSDFAVEVRRQMNLLRKQLIEPKHLILGRTERARLNQECSGRTLGPGPGDVVEYMGLKILGVQEERFLQVTP